MTEMMKTEFSRSLPQAPTVFHPRTTEERNAILVVIATLERAVNTSDGDLFDSVLSEDVIWGSPKGQIVLGLDQLNPIHRAPSLSEIILSQQINTEPTACSTIQVPSWRRLIDPPMAMVPSIPAF